MSSNNSNDEENTQLSQKSQNDDHDHDQDQDQDAPLTQRKGWRRRIRHFTWNWFASTMSTGALAVVLAQAPLRFKGLQTIGKIFFIIDIVMFLALCTAIITRFILRPAALSKSLHHPAEALFFGSFWVSIALILNASQAYGVPSCGPWLITALRVSFWLYAALVFLVAVFQYAKLFIAEHLRVEDAMPAWILPMYPFLVLGPLAATLAPSQPQHYAVQMLVAGIMFQGLGWMVSIFMYTIYILRLMANSLPSPATRPGMFISVGPAGYTSAAFISLGVQARDLLPPGFMNTPPSLPTGEILRLIGITAGIFLWLLALWFFSITTWGIITGLNLTRSNPGKRGMRFTLTWWAFIFPNGGLTLATIQIANVLDSEALRVLSSVMACALVGAWVFVVGACVWAVWRGVVLWPGCDDDKDMKARG